MSDYMITYNCPECRKLLAKVARLERKLRKARPAKCSTCKEAKFSRDLKRAAALAKRLTKEKQEEFDIATGYHKKWVAAERKLAEAREALAAVEPALVSYARDNPLWRENGGATQDPSGVHAALELLRAALGEGEGEGEGKGD